MRPPPSAAPLASTAARASPWSQAAGTGVLAGAAVVAGAVVAMVELDEGADARNVGSVGPLLHAIRTPASDVAITTVIRSPRMVPYLPLYRRLR